MDLKSLADNFRILVDAPGSIAMLREIILELAICGKLVPQDPCDSTASVTINTPLENEGGLTKTLKGAPIPLGWTSCNLGDIVDISTGFAFQSADYESSGIFVLRVTNILPSGHIDTSQAVYFPKAKITDRIRKYFLNADDILTVMVGGSLGKVGIVPKEILPALLNQNMWRLTPKSNLLNTRFLELLIRYVNSRISGITNSTHGHLQMGKYRDQPVLLPPFSEQHRIVAKVDQLLALCDELEQKRTTLEKIKAQFCKAALVQILSNSEKAEVMESADVKVEQLPIEANF